MSYERLTTVDKDGHIDIIGIWDVDMRREDARKYHAAKTRLAELENNIDNGTLVKLPCKVGDTMYILSDPFFTACIEPVIIRKIAILGLHRIQVYATGEETHEYYENVPSEYIFKSKLEAEEKLRELRGENEHK